MSNPLSFVILGIMVHLIFWIGHKLLHSKLGMLTAILISLFMAFAAYNSQGLDGLQMKGGYAANWFYSPGLFLILYSFFRYLFKRIFKNEPIMTSYMSTSWEQGGSRKLHYGDSLFTVLTLVLPILIPLFI